MTREEPPPGLARKRALARAALWFEQLWPAVWPPLGVLGAYAAFALLNGPDLLTAWPRLVLLTVVLLVAAALLWRGLRRTAAPSGDAVDRRLERDSGLRHRPLSALQDRPVATTGPEAAALWHIHQARLRAQLRRLRVARPRPGLPSRDRWALRGLVLLVLAAALVIAGPEAPRRLLAAITPTLPTGPAAPGTVVQAWITPPAYTGLPPLVLHADQPAPPVPVGAHLTASVTGGSGAPTLALEADGAPFHALDAASWQAERDLKTPGHLVVRRGGEALADWAITLIPDHPPTATFTEPPGPALAGGRPTTRTRLAWAAADDYGVASVEAEIHLRDRPSAPPILLPIPMAGGRRTPHGSFAADLTAHPWAGLPVIGRIVAKDEPGQTGASEPAEFVLPERAFTNPTARALIAVRKQLSLTPDQRQGAARAMDMIADQPDLFDGSLGVMLHLRALGALLRYGRGDPAIDEAQARMWTLALALEEGATDRTAHALEAARQTMRDAMEAARQDPKSAEKRAELDRRMQALREAIQKHIDALAQQARRDGTEMPFDPREPQMNARDLDRMAEQVQKEAREGKMDQAQQQMAELERLLQQLQNARPEHGEQRARRNAQRRQQGRQQMDAVQDLVRREGGLLDSSRERAEADPRQAPPPSLSDLQNRLLQNDPLQQRGTQPSGPPQNRPPQNSPPQNSPQAATPSSPAGAERPRDEARQHAMRRALGELMQRFGDLTGKVPAPLGDADMAMREAGQALAKGQDGAAGAAQQKAIEALQKGSQQMGQQMARQLGRGSDPGQGEGQGEGQDEQDGQGQGDGDNGFADRGGNAPGDRDGQAGRPGGPDRGSMVRRGHRLDPLGRPLQEGSNGTDESGDTRVPDQMEEARTRAIQDELRRRGADRSRPQPELDYIDRLLKPF